MVWKCRLAFGAIRRRRRSFSSRGATIRQCARPRSMRELSPFSRNLSKTRLFWGSFRKRCRPESCSPVFGASAATFRSRLFFSLYIEERQKQETSREHRLAGPVNSRKTNVSRIIATVTATAQGTSTFVEYKYLDYVALDVGNGNH